MCAEWRVCVSIAAGVSVETLSISKNLSEMHFMNFLSESKKNQFDSLADDKKVLLVESMNKDSLNLLKPSNNGSMCVKLFFSGLITLIPNPLI